MKKSNLYLKDEAKLKVNISKQIDKTLELFLSNPEHPSLHNKHIKCKKADNLYSIRINKQYRIMYFKYKDYVELYRLLEHGKYDRLTKNC